MKARGRELVDHFGKLMAAGDINSLVEMYSDDAMVVLYYGSASGRHEIEQLVAGSLRTHGRYDVLSIDQFQQAGDIVMWDATVETDAGPLQTTHVVMLDDQGLIRRHMPRIRGYWGM